MIEIMRKLFPVYAPVLRPVKHFVFHPVEDNEGVDIGTGEDLSINIREKYILNVADWENRVQFEAEFAQFFDVLVPEDEINQESNGNNTGSPGDLVILKANSAKASDS